MVGVFESLSAIRLDAARQGSRTLTQYGQEHVCQIYKFIKRLQRNGNQITIHWTPTSEDNKLLGLAKEQARIVT